MTHYVYIVSFQAGRKANFLILVALQSRLTGKKSVKKENEGRDYLVLSRLSITDESSAAIANTADARHNGQ